MRKRYFQHTEDLLSALFAETRRVLDSPGAMMLSGGTTPFALYERWRASGRSIHPQRVLFLSDERMVPLSDPRSNAGRLLPLLEPLGGAERFVRVETTLAPEEAAAAFSRALQRLETPDFGLLGMGADGHTAGIFRMEDAQRGDGPSALVSRRADGLVGVSVSPAFLRRIRRIVLLVTGPGKREILQVLFRSPETIPAGVILRGHPSVEVWTDQPVP